MPFQGGHYGGGGGGGGGYPGGRYGGGGGGGGGGGRGGGGGWRGRNNDEEADPNSEQFRKLFVGGLSYETDEKGLKEHFEEWGEIVDCVVMRDPQSKRSRGFGFITYKDAAMVDEAQKNRVHTIDSREVETKRAMPRDSGNSGNQQSVNKMFVGGLKDDTTEEMIREVFSGFGNIEKIEMVMDKATGKPRGFCFVTFDDYDPVDKAVLKKRHDLNGRKVEVKKAQAKEQSDSRGGGGRGQGGRDRSYGGSYGGGGSGGYGGGYGGSSGYGSGGYGGGGGFQSWGGSGGGYGDYSGSWGNDGGSFGSSYGNDYGGGAMKGNSYSSRDSGPYGGGYGSGGGGGGYGGYRR